jgi:hypothetical protein
LNVVDFKSPVRARLMLFNDISHYAGGAAEGRATPVEMVSADQGATGKHTTQGPLSPLAARWHDK